MTVVVPGRVIVHLDEDKHTKRMFDNYHLKSFPCAGNFKGCVHEDEDEAILNVMEGIIEHWDKLNVDPECLEVRYSVERLDERGMAYMSPHVVRTADGLENYAKILKNRKER